MSWNYRVCKRNYLSDEYFTIHEVYYNDDGSIWAVTEEAVAAFGDSPKEIKDCLKKMQEALKKDVIDLDTLVFAPHVPADLTLD